LKILRRSRNLQNALRLRTLQSDEPQIVKYPVPGTPTSPAGWLITGHSLGGGLAAAASMKTGINAITFNAAGVNLATLRLYAPELNLSSVRQMHNQSHAIVKSYVVDWDILTRAQDGMIVAFLGLPTSLGTRITLDSHSRFRMDEDYVLSGSGLQIIETADRLYTMYTLHSYYIQGLLLSYGAKV
jgi:hypothetical protein